MLRHFWLQAQHHCLPLLLHCSEFLGPDWEWAQRRLSCPLTDSHGSGSHYPGTRSVENTVRWQCLPEGYIKQHSVTKDKKKIQYRFQLRYFYTLYSWMTPSSPVSGGGFQETRMAVPLASLFVTVTPWGALLGAKTGIEMVDWWRKTYLIWLCTLNTLFSIGTGFSIMQIYTEPWKSLHKHWTYLQFATTKPETTINFVRFYVRNQEKYGIII